MLLVLLFVLVLVLLLTRGRRKARRAARRPATGADMLAAARAGTEPFAYEVRPHLRDPIGGRRDWGL